MFSNPVYFLSFLTVDEEVADVNSELMPPPASAAAAPPLAAAVTSRSPDDEAVLNNKCDLRKSKKKPGLLRGLGSMFRFGKHRKSPSSPETTTDTIMTASGHAGPAGQAGPNVNYERRCSGPPPGISAVRSDVDRRHILRRTLPPDERDRAELGRQMAMAVARQVIRFNRLINANFEWTAKSALFPYHGVRVGRDLRSIALRAIRNCFYCY